LRDVQESKNMYDIREGLRVVLLGVAPSPLGSEKVWPPPKHDRQPATPEETLTVYRSFCEMLAMHRSGEQLPRSPKRPPPDEDEPRARSGSKEKSGAPAVPWRTYLTWVETGSITDDLRTKFVFEALLKASKTWLQSDKAAPHRKKGLTLAALFRWMWPFASCRALKDMFSWICVEEYEKIRLPEPPLIGEAERLEIKRLYEAMDQGGKGYINAFDMAGGDHADFHVRLKNTIDEASVKQILGDRPILLEEFLELMCEDGCRGHPDAMRVYLSDGRAVVKYSSDVVDFTAWVYQDLPDDHRQALHTAKGLEEQVQYWDRQANKSKGARVRLAAD